MTNTKTKKDEASADVIDVTDASTDIAWRSDVHDWFDRWADQFGMRLPAAFGNRLPEFWGASRELGGVMRIEETIDENGLTIRGEIPGIDPDQDIEITVDDGRLNIKAERRKSSEEEEDGKTRSEFQYGLYRRSCALPSGASADDIVATYDDGILTVRVPVDGKQSEATRVPVSKG